MSWPELESERTQAFSSMLTSGEFTDVTIACDDDQIQAHKVVLSAASEIFQNIFRRNPHSHPLLYFFGVTKQQMDAIIDFTYSGDTKVPMEELDTFLNIAKSLQIKGLVGSESDLDSFTLEENNTPNPITNIIETPEMNESQRTHEKRETFVDDNKHENEETDIFHKEESQSATKLKLCDKEKT